LLAKFPCPVKKLQIDLNLPKGAIAKFFCLQKAIYIYSTVVLFPFTNLRFWDAHLPNSKLISGNDFFWMTGPKSKFFRWVPAIF